MKRLSRLNRWSGKSRKSRREDGGLRATLRRARPNNKYVGLEERTTTLMPEGINAEECDIIGKDITRILHREPAKGGTSPAPLGYGTQELSVQQKRQRSGGQCYFFLTNRKLRPCRYRTTEMAHRCTGKPARRHSR